MFASIYHTYGSVMGCLSFSSFNVTDAQSRLNSDWAAECWLDLHSPGAAAWLRLHPNLGGVGHGLVLSGRIWGTHHDWKNHEKSILVWLHIA